MKNNNIFSTPYKNCPMCNSSEINILYTIKKYEESFKVDRCKNCSFIFINPKFEDSFIKKLYKEDYYSGKADYSYHDERTIMDFSRYVWDKRVTVIHKYIKQGNFLDIGASFGGFCKSAKKYFTPHGIEISQYAGNYAKQLIGDSIHIGTLDSHAFEYNSFSVITMIELLEHLSDPVKVISECYKLLKDDSLLVIQTANMAGMQAKIFKDRYAYFMPGHLSCFTKKNLTELLKKTGFRKIKVFQPVEFGLLPKLRKSRHSFKSILDYRKWIRISFYHLFSKIHIGNFSTTSSMVIYAFKPPKSPRGGL